MLEALTQQWPSSLRLENIYKSYGAIKVLEGIDLTIQKNKSVCVLGRSGCGKSTLLKVIALLTRPDSGKLYIDDRDITGMQQEELDILRSNLVAYSFQEPLLLPYLTAIENITVLLNVEEKKALEIINELGLGERAMHRPTKLSGGEKKRLDIARAILRNCPILVADEPLSNLDPDSASKVINLLKRHKERGGIVIYSSVDPSGAEYADNVVNMERRS
jgi:ABC-type lipoprotein export system ATPase subunit